MAATAKAGGSESSLHTYYVRASISRVIIFWREVALLDCNKFVL